MIALSEDVVVADRFRLVQRIGQGGMGSVWRAIHVGLDTPCALKFIEGEHANGAEAHARFEREAKAAAQLRSPHVVQVFDHGVWEGRPYIAMELLEGEDLGRHLSQHGGRLPAPEVCFVVQQVCRALSRAHQAGVVHRDLKPENIFVVRDDDRDLVKILDFGVAKSSGVVVSGSNTKTGALIGTPYYMSPEQAQGTKTVDARSDLWSLAVIVFQCLTGRFPFESEALGDLLLKIIVAPLPVPSECTTGLPAGFDEWWRKAADRNPDNRYQTAKELGESLAVALGRACPPEGMELSRLHRVEGASRANATVMTPLEAKAPPGSANTVPASVAASEAMPRGLRSLGQTPSSRRSEARPPPRVALEVIRVISGDDEVRALVEGLNEGVRDALAKNTALSVTTGDPAGAGFVLKGSVQGVGKRLRFSFVLEEVASSEQVWTERYDRQLDDVFTLQDEIVNLVAVALRTSIKMRLFAELGDADDTTLAFPQLLDKAAGLFHLPGAETTRRAIVTLRRALEATPDSSMAASMLGYALYDLAEHDALAIPQETADEMLTLLDSAVTRDPRSYVARSFKAMAVHDLLGDHLAARELASEALTRNATFIKANALVAITDIHLGRVDEGTRRLREVMTAGPDDASHPRHRRELAIGHWLKGDAAEGLRIAAKLWREAPDIGRNAVVVVALSVAAGEIDEARRHADALKRAAPGITLATARLPRIGDPEARARFTDALSASGL